MTRVTAATLMLALGVVSCCGGFATRVRPAHLDEHSRTCARNHAYRPA